MKAGSWIVSLGLFLVLVEAQADTGQMKTNIDWPSYIAGQDLHWSVLPRTWMEAPFIGNGLMGSMLFQQDDHSLVIQIGRSDVQDHRTQAGKAETGKILPDQSRLPIGYFTLKTTGKIQGCSFRLNLWDAEISGALITDCGKISLAAFIHSEQNLLVVDAHASSGEAGFSYEWHPENAFCPRVKLRRAMTGQSYLDQYEPNPAPRLETAGDLNLCVQDLLSGGQTATSWMIRSTGKTRKTLLASVGHSFPESTAATEATAVVESAKETPVADLQASHRIWWHAFYPKSFVSIPDARMESFFWIQHYKMACASKGGQVIVDNTGPWLQPTSWPALWWNLNVQLAYSHVLPANHHELSVGLLNNLVKHQDHLVKNVPEEMRHDSIAISTVSGQDLLSPMGEPLVNAGVSVGNMTWVLHNCYMQYRYTMDEAILCNHIYPLLTKAINYYRHCLIEGDDGKIHLPVMNSPEYPNGDVEDCNYDLSLLRWGCQTLIKSASTLGIDDPLLPSWKDISDRLVDYPQNETGLMIGKNMPYAVSHRHYSHLLMFYPLSILNLDDLADKKLAEKSLWHWLSLPEALEGYSFTGSSSMFSLLGNGEMAERKLQDFLSDKILRNTFYKEGVGHPVIETPLAGARSVLDMLIQSWGDEIRVFPAVPESWPNVAFADLRAEGAFLVSAVRMQGKTAFISIKSLAGEPCRVQTGMKGEIKVEGLEPKDVMQLGGGLVELMLQKGQEVIISDAAYDGDFSIEPVVKTIHADWVWGKIRPGSGL